MYPFKEGSFAIRNGWYVAGFREDISRQPIARTILNMPMAFYRKEDGTPVAVGGRCPHRHFPLGKSCTQGDTIVCGYHGIAFGPDGKCVNVPSQNAVPAAYRIPAYPAVDHGMWVFVWPGDAEKADTALLPDLVEIGLEGADLTAQPISTREVQSRYQLLNDNLLDLTHLAFLHSSSIGTIDNARQPEELTRSDGLLRSRRYIRDGEPTPSLRERQGYDGLVDSVIGMDFYLPGLHAGFGDHFVAQSAKVDPGRVLQTGRVYHAITPSTPTSTYYFFGIANSDPTFMAEAKAFLDPVLDEDVFAAEEIEKMLSLVGENIPELMLKSDRNAVEGRRMMQKWMDKEHALTCSPEM